MTGDDHNLWQRCHAAAADETVNRDLRAIYCQLDADVQKRGPTCWVSGRCCNFDQHGHLLYVTALEIAWVIRRVDDDQKSDAMRSPSIEGGQSDPPVNPSVGLPVMGVVDEAHGPCKYQVNGLCSIHAIRPMGCRIYFCQSGTQQWQQQLYERYLARLRKLHERRSIPYRYMEWRSGLDEAHRAIRSNRPVASDPR